VVGWADIGIVAAAEFEAVAVAFEWGEVPSIALSGLVGKKRKRGRAYRLKPLPQAIVSSIVTADLNSLLV
jgi:hypothetical protein